MFKPTKPEEIKLKLAFITVTLDTKAVSWKWILLVMATAMVLNLILWPVVILLAFNLLFGTELSLTFKTFVGIWLFLLTLAHFSKKD
jgi:hypothetical protein